MRSIVSKYKRGKIWYLRYAKYTGIPIKSLRTSDEKLAEVVRLNEVQRLVLGRFSVRDKPFRRIRYSVFVKLFLEHTRNAGAYESTLATYTYPLDNFGRFLRKDLYLHAIAPDMIEAYVASRREAGRKQKTIRNDLTTLNTSLRFALKNRYVMTNPLEEISLPKKERHPPIYLRRADYLKLKETIQDSYFKDLVDFYILTGCRRNEGLQIRLEDMIDLERGVLTIPQSKQRDFRAFPMSAELKIVVHRLIEHANKATGRLISVEPYYLSHHFKRYVLKAGLSPKLTFHSLRHTFATWAVDAGVGSRALQELIGHRDSQSTQIYIHPVTESLKSEVQKLKLPRNASQL